MKQVTWSGKEGAYVSVPHDNPVNFIRHHWTRFVVLRVHILVKVLNHSWRERRGWGVVGRRGEEKEGEGMATVGRRREG